jgi:hypothetical protein
LVWPNLCIFWLLFICWYPLIFIQTNFGRDHDHERYKQMKSSQNIQRLGHTKFTSCSSDLKYLKLKYGLSLLKIHEK